MLNLMTVSRVINNGEIHFRNIQSQLEDCGRETFIYGCDSVSGGELNQNWEMCQSDASFHGEPWGLGMRISFW